MLYKDGQTLDDVKKNFDKQINSEEPNLASSKLVANFVKASLLIELEESVFYAASILADDFSNVRFIFAASSSVTTSPRCSLSN
jgi:hypothetical protein